MFPPQSVSHPTQIRVISRQYHEAEQWLVDKLGLSDSPEKALEAGQRRTDLLLRLLTGDLTVEIVTQIIGEAPPNEVERVLKWLRQDLLSREPMNNERARLIVKIFDALVIAAQKEAACGSQDGNLYAEMIMSCAFHTNQTVRQLAGRAARTLEKFRLPEVNILAAEVMRRYDPSLSRNNPSGLKLQNSDLPPMDLYRMVQEAIEKKLLPSDLMDVNDQTEMAVVTTRMTQDKKEPTPREDSKFTEGELNLSRRKDIAKHPSYPVFAGSYEIYSDGTWDPIAYYQLRHHMETKSRDGGLTIFNLYNRSEKSYVTLVLAGNTISIVNPYPMRKEKGNWYERAGSKCQLDQPSEFTVSIADYIASTIRIEPIIINYNSIECFDLDCGSSGGNLKYINYDNKSSKNNNVKIKSFGELLSNWIIKDKVPRDRVCDNSKEIVTDFLNAGNSRSLTSSYSILPSVTIVEAPYYRKIERPSIDELSSFYEDETWGRYERLKNRLNSNNVESNRIQRNLPQDRPTLMHYGVESIKSDEEVQQVINCTKDMIDRHLAVQDDRQNICTMLEIYNKDSNSYFTLILSGKTACLVDHEPGKGDGPSVLRRLRQSIAVHLHEDGRIKGGNFRLVQFFGSEFPQLAGKCWEQRHEWKARESGIEVNLLRPKSYDFSKKMDAPSRDRLESCIKDTGLSGARLFRHIQEKYRNPPIFSSMPKAWEFVLDFRTACFDPGEVSIPEHVGTVIQSYEDLSNEIRNSV